MCVRNRPHCSLPTIDHPLSPLFSFHALRNPSSTLIDLQVLSFHALTNPFSRNPFPFTSIQNAGGVGANAPSSTPRSLRLPARQAGISGEKPPNSFPDIPLRTLEISLLSFSTSRPLFSIACGLFLQNRGVWGGGRGRQNVCGVQRLLQEAQQRRQRQHSPRRGKDRLISHLRLHQVRSRLRRVHSHQRILLRAQVHFVLAQKIFAQG